ncbi:anaphase-promoting complex subunit 5-like [Acipenser oxyrinchus oxyrinchus]|uniref:Anaphase-promoting complex subunit 5 n=1 Tax=Acipenser oxyrinchus oxyrinchus TaxID=40147 RepID=A0AAD8G0W1_ACIOX|nr:anaphase-promoting complex subunit 5-like [Acipenser oxyrinchus oxyrinchus]
MASVHESLYFNPMMTNGVVHANVFGVKDWVTPYKITVLMLLDEMTISTSITLLDRRRLNKLILPLLQSPDMTLSELIKTVEDSCPQLAYTVHLRLQLMADGELKDMEHFFDMLPSPFNETESEAHKTSVVGLFMRHMVLAYNKLSFSQVYKLYTALQQYYQSYERKDSPAAEPAEDTDMELTNTEELGGKMEKEELDLTPSDDEVSTRGPLSQKQAEYFLAQQAYLLKNDENKALDPAALQKELNNMLKFNPDFAEAHYLSYLNSMRVQDIFNSTDSLLHYFDRLILPGGDSKSNGDEGCGRSLRYAALNLAALHCRFGHYQQAELALQEAIRIAQESNDHVCLQHCLSWLYLLEQMKGSDSTLTEHAVKMAVHFCLPYLASLGIQSLVQQGAVGGKTANKLMDALKDTDLLHWKHSLSELIDVSIAQKTAIWRMYGKSTMALQQAQVLLSMNSLEPVNLGVQQNNSEAFAVALCHLSELHAEQGLFAAASEILKHLRERFPPHSQHAKLWMLCDQKIQFDRAMNDGKYHMADSLVVGIAALSKTEGLYRKALVLKARNQTTEAYKVLQRLLLYCEKIKGTEMTIRVMLSLAELHWSSSCHAVALPLLLRSLAVSREYHLQYLASECILHLAFSQLMLGIPEQALNILHMAIESILAHGALLDKGRAMLLVAKCQIVTASSEPSKQQKTQALEVAVQNLEEAGTYFTKVDCKERVRDIYYLQARLYHSLGKTAERNKCAMLFRQLNQELPSQGVPLITRL